MSRSMRDNQFLGLPPNRKLSDEQIKEMLKTMKVPPEQLKLLDDQCEWPVHEEAKGG